MNIIYFLLGTVLGYVIYKSYKLKKELALEEKQVEQEFKKNLQGEFSLPTTTTFSGQYLTSQRLEQSYRQVLERANLFLLAMEKEERTTKMKDTPQITADEIIEFHEAMKDINNFDFLK